MKPWIDRAISTLDSSLNPVPIELNELDWKLELSPNKNKLAQHLSAFSNHPNGGYLVFGIDEHTGDLYDITQDKAEMIIKQLSNLSRDALEPQISLEHAIVKYKNKDLLLIWIKESREKPVCLRGKSLEHCFIRSGGSTRSASRPEIGFLLLNSPTLHWEQLRASALMNKQAIIQKIDVDGFFSLLGQPTPEKEEELLQKLRDEKLIDIESDGYFITNFGAISSAHRLSDFDSLSRKSTRVIQYNGLSKAESLSEKEGSKGYAIGFENLINYVIKALPRSEVIEAAFRKKVSVYPEIALRELIANMLIHQDFSISGAGPMIDIYQDRIEFTNPGTLLPSKKLDRLIGATPESRNEVLAKGFRRYNICEERGTGFIKVITAVELYGLPPVQFETGSNYFKVTLAAPRKFADMSQTERIEACYQHATLKYYSSSVMTNSSLRERLKMSEGQRPQVSKLIAEAVELGRIKRKNPDGTSSKFVEYIPYWA